MEINEHGGWIIPDDSEFPDEWVFPAFSVFGNGCTLGEGCKLGEGCTLGNGCKLGNWCTLGEGCKLGDWCTLGEGCKLGDWCTLGEGCMWLGVIVLQWLTMANVDGSGRQVKIVKHADGVMIEAGCFRGSHQGFLDRALSEDKLTYVAVIGAVCNAMLSM